MVRQSKEKQTENKRYATAIATKAHYSDACEPAEESASSHSQLPLQSTVNTRPVSQPQPPAKKPKRDRSVEMRTLQAAMKHPFKEINCSCKKKCIEKVSTSARRKIHSEFWQLDVNKRRDFIYNRVRRSCTNESTVAGHVSRRESTFTYSLIHPDTNEIIPVCKVLFLTTLGFHPKNDAAVMSVMAATPRNSSTAAPDKRGRHTRVTRWMSII